LSTVVEHDGEGRNKADAGSTVPDVRVITFYLPQFHPIPENDGWWGEGFTEWTNVRKAHPNFLGHYQPHVPSELGYYDLRGSDVQEAQAALARLHGIHGFCYYYYWFNGRRLLERPLEAMLARGRPEFPFCVCWANENWTRRWDGLDHEILLAQRYSLEDSRAFMRELLPVLEDRRYIRVHGRPLLLIYRSDAIPELAATVALWREEARRGGIGELYLVAALTSWRGDPAAFGFDAAVEFPPHGHAATSVAHACDFTNPGFTGMVWSYRSYVAQMLLQPQPDFKLFRTLMPAWDNTPRRQDAGTIFVGSSPEVFGYWLEQVVAQTRSRFAGDERLVFINAWNEWGEGCHLEPDERYGRQYLEAIRAALAAPPQ
jgi:lipopolysaccharide biosynthesis protein